MSTPVVPPTPENPYAAHDDVAVKRLALQGHRSAARELARRGGCETILAFLERFLTVGERERLSASQFDCLDDAFEEHWAAAHRDTVELVDVSKTNLMLGWGKT